MKVFTIEYKGEGSGKQVKLARCIFNRKLKDLKSEYDNALLRVESGSMPDTYKVAWDSVLNYGGFIGFVEFVSRTSAKAMIEYRGCPRNTCFATITAKLANKEFKKIIKAKQGSVK